MWLRHGQNPFFFSSRRRHTKYWRDWSSDVCSSDLEALESARRVAALYDQGQRHLNAEEWQQAFECFEEIQRLEPGYRETETHLSRVQQALAPPPTVEVPDLGGQKISQASSTLADRNLKLG